MPRSALIAVVAVLLSLVGVSTAQAKSFNVWTQAGANGGRAHTAGTIEFGCQRCVSIDAYVDDVCQGATKGDNFNATVEFSVYFRDGTHDSTDYKDDRGCTKAGLPIKFSSIYSRQVKYVNVFLVELRTDDHPAWGDQAQAIIYNPRF